MIRRILNIFSSAEITLEIKGRAIKFFSPSDFEFFLAGRTAVPASKIKEMVKYNLEQLKSEARSIKKIEKHFVSIMAKSIEKSDDTDHFFQESDINSFSQDHAWRQIASALNKDNDKTCKLRNIVLVKYLQYLSSRQEVIRCIYAEKKKYENIIRDEQDSQTDKDQPCKETLILDSSLFEDDAPALNDSKFCRIPKGERIPIKLKFDESIPIILSKHKCEIYYNDRLFFVDSIGGKQPVFLGQNKVGRDTSGTIVIDSVFRDVSRLHLVIENAGGGLLKLIDLSSHGTYLPSEFI